MQPMTRTSDPPRAPGFEEVVVRSRQTTMRGTAPNGISISREEGRRVPGTQGDALKAVENLGGVARPALGSGQLVVWGSAPNETRVYIDGVEIPALYHNGGLRSTIASDLVRRIELSPGGYGAAYGRGLGGLVRVETRQLPERGVHGHVALDVLDTGAMLTAAASDRVRVGVAARQSHLDRIAEPFVEGDANDLFPIPRYRDAQVKATIRLRPGESVSLVTLGSQDRLRRSLPSNDPARTRFDETHAAFTRFYARYTRSLSGGQFVSVTPFVGVDQNSARSIFGDVPAVRTTTTARYGLRASHRHELATDLSLELGVDAMGRASVHARSGSLSIPAREGDRVVFGQPPGGDVNFDRFTTNIVEVAPYATVDWTFRRLSLAPGVRVNVLLTEGSRKLPRVGATPPIGYSRIESAVEPRMAARYAVTDAVTVNGAFGTYHQAPDGEDLSAVFGTPDLVYSRATHVTAGATVQLSKTTTFDVVAFHKSLRDLVFRSRRPAPLLARALIQDGEGRSDGVQILLRQELWKGFFGWLSYTLSRSERRYAGDPEYRKFDFDQPHVLSLVASQTIGAWTFGTRFRYASGAPRTPVSDAFYDAAGDAYQPVFGALNTTRLPAFHQLDVRVERTIRIKPVELSLYLEVQNVTARKNVEEFAYSRDYRQRLPITGIPPLAIVGARVEF